MVMFFPHNRACAMRARIVRERRSAAGEITDAMDFLRLLRLGYDCNSKQDHYKRGQVFGKG
jgi:hypothetical protein